MDKNLIDPENKEQVLEALIGNPRLRAFLDTLRGDVGESVRRQIHAHPPARFGALAAYKEGEHNIQLMAEQVAKDKRIACAAGCWWCCTKPVEVTIPEVLIIADAIEDWPAEEKERVVQHARAYMAKMAGKPQKKWVYQRQRCPLLGDDGNCTVYESRPIICRGWTSTDAARCEAGYNARWSTGMYEQVFEYLIVVQTLAEELRAVLREPIGILQEYMLAPALLIALTTENVVARWVRGEELFESARWKL